MWGRIKNTDRGSVLSGSSRNRDEQAVIEKGFEVVLPGDSFSFFPSLPPGPGLGPRPFDRRAPRSSGASQAAVDHTAGAADGSDLTSFPREETGRCRWGRRGGIQGQVSRGQGSEPDRPTGIHAQGQRGRPRVSARVRQGKILESAGTCDAGWPAGAFFSLFFSSVGANHSPGGGPDRDMRRWESAVGADVEKRDNGRGRIRLGTRARRGLSPPAGGTTVTPGRKNLRTKVGRPRSVPKTISPRQAGRGVSDPRRRQGPGPGLGPRIPAYRPSARKIGVHKTDVIPFGVNFPEPTGCQPRAWGQDQPPPGCASPILPISNGSFRTGEAAYAGKTDGCNGSEKKRKKLVVRNG